MSSSFGVLVIASYWAVSFFLLLGFLRPTMAAFLWILLFLLPAAAVATAAAVSLDRRVGPAWALSSVAIGALCGMFGT